MDDNVKKILTDIRRGIKAEKLEDCEVRTWEDMVDIDIPVFPTPSARLNVALGVGGLPRGRIVEIFGSESSGKTTLTLHAIASAQKAGCVAGFIDVEHSLSPTYASNLGINMDNLVISQPDTGDDAMQLAKIMVENGVALIVIDSVSALVSKEELKKGITESNIGLQARMMSQGLRQLVGPVSKSNSCIIFTNQVREKVGVMYGNPETTSGGRALKFYSSIRIRISSVKSSGDIAERGTSRIKIVKNKLAAPFKECDVDIIYGKGIDNLSDTVLFSKELGIIEQNGPYYKLPKFEGLVYEDDLEEIKIQGLEKVYNFVQSVDGYLDKLMIRTKEVYGTKIRK